MRKKNKLHIISSCILLSMGFGLTTACTAGFEDANRPGTKLSAEELRRDNYTTGTFLKQMQNEAFPEQENAYQMCHDLIGNYLGRYLAYTKHDWNNGNHACFNAPNDWVRYPFAKRMPKVISAFKEISRLTGNQGVSYAMALLFRTHSLLRLTDIYGPLPIGLEEDPNAYSSQERVYKQLLKDLDEAIGIIKPLVTSMPGFKFNADNDAVYYVEMVEVCQLTQIAHGHPHAVR